MVAEEDPSLYFLRFFTLTLYFLSTYERSRVLVGFRFQTLQIFVHPPDDLLSIHSPQSAKITLIHLEAICERKMDVSHLSPPARTVPCQPLQDRRTRKIVLVIIPISSRGISLVCQTLDCIHRNVLFIL